MLYRFVALLTMLLMVASSAAGQMYGLGLTRYVYARAMLSTGESTSRINDGSIFGPPYVGDVSAALESPEGVAGRARARQNSWMNLTGAGGYFRAVGDVSSAATSVTSEAYALSFMLYDFNLAETSHIRIGASAEIVYSGLAFGDEPPDRGGYASVVLSDISGVNRIVDLTLDLEQGADAVGISMVLPAGFYRIVAHADMRASSAEVIGTAPGAGVGAADVRFAMRVVPAPGTAVAMGLCVAVARRRRCGRA